MEGVFLAGRLLFALIFIASGVGHIAQWKTMSEYAASVGLPFADLLVPLTGIQLLAGAASVALGVWADLGALVIASFLVPTTFVMHAFWKVTDPQEAQMQQVNFLKNVALLGGALVVFVLVSEFGQDWGLLLTDPLFG